VLTESQLESFRTKLHELRGALDERLASVRADACHGSGAEDAGGLSNAPIHPADLGSQEADIVVNLGVAVNEASLRQEIDEALRRLEAGKFGICESCHREIAFNRLEAVPYTRQCIQCAQRSQQDERS
jgi:RNA polymerase-binding protein DksA